MNQLSQIEIALRVFNRALHQQRAVHMPDCGSVQISLLIEALEFWKDNLDGKPVK